MTFRGNTMGYQSIWEAKKADILKAANKVKDANPAAWEEVKVPGQKSRTFISLVASECQKTVSPDIGCNLKRGGPDLSLDVLAMPNPSGCRDATGTFAGLELIDIIGGAEGPDAHLTWGDATQKTIDAGVPGGWATGTTPPPVVTPPAPTLPPYPGDPVFDQIGVALFADYALAGQAPNPGMGRWFGRTTFDYLAGMSMNDSIAKHRAEWRAALWKAALGLPQ